MKNIFNEDVSLEFINRINNLSPQSKALWGSMTVDQMLAHCNVTYELIYEENKHPKPGAFMKIILKYIVKPTVTSEKPYNHSLKTAPAFIIKGNKNFEEEKARLIAHITTTQQLGENYFDNKVSHSFGQLAKHEWNNMFSKHLDHHLNQFGA